MATVTKDMLINDIIQIDQGIIPILMSAGLHCFGCPSAQAETLEEAGLVHGMDAEHLVTKINDYLATKN